jgi:N-methylhydantoinase A/acetophenone carboxylase
MSTAAETTIDIDIGGTFTDCFVRTGAGRTAAVKTPTTGYRLAVAFMRGLEAAAVELGTDVRSLLADTETIRYSTTVAMNTLLQRLGPRLGLLVTEGYEDLLRVAKGAAWMDAATLREVRDLSTVTKPQPLVAPEMTLGVQERVDSFGDVMRPLDEDHLLEGLRGLVDQGARGFVVSLLFSYLNPIHERRIRELIESEYPECYLGSMPIMLSSEVLPKRWEYTRTNTVVLNAYLHQSMWEELSGMNDDLRDLGYRRGIMMVHNTGGMAEIYGTSAVHTYNGGPVAGLIGGSAVGAELGYDNVVVTDMGGTSFDIGLVVAGSTRFYQFRPIIDRYWVDMSILETRSIGAGGGSIAWLNEAYGNRLEVGPRGAGSMPGPACYGYGNTEPTVTDADVVLGYINPDHYFGGQMKLQHGLAEEAIREKIADPLGLSVEEAAARIKRTVDSNMADVIARETYLRGYDPKQFILFAYGGAGPTHCVGYGSVLGIERIVVFPFSPVFCAWGSSTMPVTHIYEASRRIELLSPMAMIPITDYDTFNGVVAELERQARKDFENEGYDPDQVSFGLELDMKYGGQIHIHRANAARTRLTGEEDVRAVCEAFRKEYAEVFSPVNVYPEGGVEIHNFVLRASLPAARWALVPRDDAGRDPAAARTGTRPVYWETAGGRVDTPIYDENALRPGNAVEGPAVIEGEYTTVVVDPGWSADVDRYLNLVITKKGLAITKKGQP